jgi:dihydroorotate dehydrogenase electron transfer subunit
MPFERPPRVECVSTVIENKLLCREHFRLTLRCDSFPPTAPGQFVQVACRDLDRPFAEAREYDWSPGQRLEPGARTLLEPAAMLRRPFSLAGRRETASGVELQIIHRVVGVGTRWLSELKPGDTCHLLGPIGNVFTPPPEGGIALLVGGGAGRKAIAFAGATSRELLSLTITDDAPPPASETSCDPLYNVAEFASAGVPAVLCTDDGSYGYRGFVTGALEAYLDRWITDNADRMRAVIYTCGPEAMMKRVAEIAMRRQIACQVCVERAMACGMGTCQSCCIKVKKADPSKPPLAGSDWCYRLACTDGPVFPADVLLW